MGKNRKTFDFLRWLQLSKGKYLAFAARLIRNAEGSRSNPQRQPPYI